MREVFHEHRLPPLRDVGLRLYHLMVLQAKAKSHLQKNDRERGAGHVSHTAGVTDVVKVYFTVVFTSPTACRYFLRCWLYVMESYYEYWMSAVQSYERKSHQVFIGRSI